MGVWAYGRIGVSAYTLWVQIYQPVGENASDVKVLLISPIGPIRFAVRRGFRYADTPIRSPIYDLQTARYPF